MVAFVSYTRILFNPIICYWLVFTKPGKWAVLYLSVMGYVFASFYDFSIGLRNCSNSVVFFSSLHHCFFKYAITLLFYFLLCARIKLVIFVQWQICRTMKWKILICLQCRSLCRIVIRPLDLDHVRPGMTLYTKQQMVNGFTSRGLESISYTDTKIPILGKAKPSKVCKCIVNRNWL
jgi:hypothetical protein